MERTARGKFEGGDAAWEEERLGSYSRSEVRLVEIQEKLCTNVERGRDQVSIITELFCQSMIRHEECRLLGYKNPLLTSQETHYISTTEASQLMLCKISGFHGSDYEECRPLGCYAMWLL
jgi:hypothetical protein